MQTKSVVPFQFRDHQVRTVTDKSGNPWFVAKDVCDILEIVNSRDAVKALGDDELMSVKATSGGQTREINVVSESGLYRLIFRSNKPEAETFRKWVFSEVLPEIRKTGRYELHDDEQSDAPVTSGTIPVTVARLEEAARGVKAAMIMARALGYRQDQARLMATGVVRDITGVDALALFNISGDEEAERLPVLDKQPPADWAVREIFGRFISEACALDEGTKTPATVLYERFLTWFAQNNDYGLDEPSQRKFGALMARHFRRVKSSGYVHYIGVKEVRA